MSFCFKRAAKSSKFRDVQFLRVDCDVEQVGTFISAPIIAKDYLVRFGRDPARATVASFCEIDIFISLILKYSCQGLTVETSNVDVPRWETIF